MTTHKELSSLPKGDEASKNLKAYAHLLWRIFKRRQSESIDKKSSER